MLVRKDVEPASDDAVQMSADARGHYLKDEAVPWVHPFWRTSASDDMKLVNMKLTTQEVKGEKVPVLINTRKIPAGEQLIRFCDKKRSTTEATQKKKARKA